MPSIEITGGEQFAALAGRIRRAEGELPHELTQALERSAPPLIAAAKRSAAANLPRRGGLAGIVAASDMSTQPRAGGIRIVARGITQLPLTNTGFVRHPTFNHRTAKAWVTQAIPKAREWFTRPMHEKSDTVRRELDKALNKIARRIA